MFLTLTTLFYKLLLVADLGNYQPIKDLSVKDGCRLNYLKYWLEIYRENPKKRKNVLYDLSLLIKLNQEILFTFLNYSCHRSDV